MGQDVEEDARVSQRVARGEGGGWAELAHFQPARMRETLQYQVASDGVCVVGTWVKGVGGESVGTARGRRPQKGGKSHQSRMDLVSTGGTLEGMVA